MKGAAGGALGASIGRVEADSGSYRKPRRDRERNDDKPEGYHQQNAAVVAGAHRSE